MQHSKPMIEASEAHGPMANSPDLTPPQPVIMELQSRQNVASEHSQRIPVSAQRASEEEIRPPSSERISITTALQLEGNTDVLPSSMERQNVTSVLPSLKSPYLNRWRAAACLIAYFTQGLNDGAIGALLPYVERRYRVSYAVVSLLFMAKAIGSLTAGPLTHKLNQRFGRSKTLTACALSNMIAWILIITEPPYPLVVVAFYLSGKEERHASLGVLLTKLGFCFSTISALDNVFIVNLQGGTVLLGFMQGFYGVGGEYIQANGCIVTYSEQHQAQSLHYSLQ